MACTPSVKMTGPAEYWDSFANWIIKIIFCANGFITFDSRVFECVAEDKSLRVESHAHRALHIRDLISKNGYGSAFLLESP